MRTKKLKTTLILIHIIFSMNSVLAQCPISFPKSIDVCLEGVLPSNSICFQNSNGNLNLLLNGSDTNNKKLFSFLKNGNFKMGDSIDDSYNKLIIAGPNKINSSINSPTNYRDISYEFLSAGSAKIRSFRGGSMDTYIQFLTNSYGTLPDNPQVRMQITENGNIGIGTTNPQALLDVNGDVNMSGNFLKFNTSSNQGDAIINRSTSGNLVINSGNNQGSSVYLNYSQAYGAGNGGIRIYDGDVQNYVNLKMITTTTPNSEGTFLISPSGGRVVISNSNDIPTTPSGYKLYVTEGILSEKFKAAIKSSSQWSDYVFDKKYKLKSLDEVEQYIILNKHLPNIPSSEEIIKDGGIDLAQMQAKQMEKIEELTLYLIEMKKEIKSLKKENTELRESLKK